jgi:RNA polymerase sigma-70 factor (ECF subfamily)
MKSRGIELSSQSASSPTSSDPSAEGELPPAERQWVERVVNGDRTAYRPLVESYEAAVFGLCRRRLGGSEAEAEDLSQETFLRAYRRIGELKDLDRFGPWLYQIARSLCRDRVRHLIAERRALQGRVDLARWNLVRELPGGEIASVLSELPARERKALELKYFEGRSYKEIADALGLTFARVDHLIREARSHLARRLEVARQRERSL